MANLTETSVYETGIYQLERTDIVDAGIGGNGVANTQAKLLANRTKYLKSHVDSIENNPSRFRQVIVISATTVLNNTHYGALIEIKGNTGNISITLPTSASSSMGDRIVIVNKSNYEVTISKVGTDTIDGAATSLTLKKLNDFADLVLDLINTDFVVKSSRITGDIKVLVELSNATQNTTSSTYVDMTTLSYTTTKTAIYKVRLIANPTSGNSGSGAVLDIQTGSVFRIFNSTDSIVLDEKAIQNRISLDVAAGANLGVTTQQVVVCERIMSIDAGKTIKAQFKTLNTNTTTTNNYLFIEEVNV